MIEIPILHITLSIRELTTTTRFVFAITRYLLTPYKYAVLTRFVNELFRTNTNNGENIFCLNTFDHKLVANTFLERDLSQISFVCDGTRILRD